MGARGFTLVELIVVLAITAGVSLVAGVSLSRVAAPDARPSGRAARLEAARVEAIRTARPVKVVLDSVAPTEVALVLPDGRMVGPSPQPLTSSSWILK
jgi:prepilin-type N-terminal cleavage/methylation domain-containing protein